MNCLENHRCSYHHRRIAHYPTPCAKILLFVSVTAHHISRHLADIDHISLLRHFAHGFCRWYTNFTSSLVLTQRPKLAFRSKLDFLITIGTFTRTFSAQSQTSSQRDLFSLFALFLNTDQLHRSTQTIRVHLTFCSVASWPCNAYPMRNSKIPRAT